MEDKDRKTIKVKVNGTEYLVNIPSDRMLVEMLREDLGFTGTKLGCGNGECGACSVIMDGRLINSCMVPAMKADGSEILTVEGLTQGDNLHPIQEAFIKHGAVQCGFCTPGMMLSAVALLRENPRATRGEIQKAISGNLCRCTGYVQIIDGIQSLIQSSE